MRSRDETREGSKGTREEERVVRDRGRSDEGGREAD